MLSKSIGNLIPTRKKVVLPFKMKIKIRFRESLAPMPCSLNVHQSTVRSIKISEDKISHFKATTSLLAKIIRDPAIEKMEPALTF